MIIVYELKQRDTRVPNPITQVQIDKFANKIHQRFNIINVKGSIMQTKVVFRCTGKYTFAYPLLHSVDFIIYFDATFQYEFNQNKIFKAGEF